MSLPSSNIIGKPLSIMVAVLLVASGCGNPESPQSNGDDASQEDQYTIVEVPRPNSGTHSTAEAKKLLPKFLARSAPIVPTNPLVIQWQSPTQGMRVHVSADNTIHVHDFYGSDHTGMDSVKTSLDSIPTFGNARSVLLTSDQPGWDSPTKRDLIDILFTPSVLLHIVDRL